MSRAATLAGGRWNTTGLPRISILSVWFWRWLLGTARAPLERTMHVPPASSLSVMALTEDQVRALRDESGRYPFADCGC